MGLNFTRRQWLTLTVMGLGNFFNSICISLQAPFFPKEAELKGATPSEYGFVFGVYELVGFIVSPFFGQYINQIGAKFLFNAGIFTASITSILFGTLNMINGHTMFITFAFLIRIIEAFGNTAFLTASFAIIAKEFSSSVATTFAAMETFFGLGLFLGPLIGGALYQLDGFYLPFLTTGLLLLATAIITNIILPQNPSTTNSTTNGPTMLQVLKIPDVAINAMGMIATSISLGFLSATLEPHLRQFNLSPIHIGSLFIINGGIYGAGAPLMGWMIDKFLNPKVSSLIGCILIVCGFTFLGPASFLPYETAMWSVILGLILHGCSVACLFVSVFIDSLRACVREGFPDDTETYGLISGLFASTLAFGAFIGPSAGGILFDMVGFRNGVYFVIVAGIITGISYAIILVHQKKENDRDKYSKIESGTDEKKMDNVLSGDGLSLFPNRNKVYGSVEENLLFLKEIK